jgi:CDP-glucose 4,6-dehydratase
MEGVEVTDRSFWAGRRVLVTGHTGFKGAWLSLWLERLGAQVTGLALPPESPDGAFSVFTPWPSLESHLADLRDADAVEGVIEATAPEVVFHLAAQSLVGRGWAHPADTYAVNVVGTAHLLEAVSRVRSVQAVVVVTSDKVYANNGTGGPFREDSPLGGADPYSASKAATEHVVTAWRAGNPEVPIATVRAGNVIGGGDVADDRLLPDAWRALLAAKDFVVRHPDATRPWQFVLEPLAGYLLVAERLAENSADFPPAVNFGPAQSACWPVAQIADAVLDAWGEGRWVEDRDPAAPPETPDLSIDATLAKRTLGWRPRLDIDTAIRWTVEWWRATASGSDLRSLASDQITAYEKLLV